MAEYNLYVFLSGGLACQGAALYFNKGKEPRIAIRELIPPPPAAEHCALWLEFTLDGSLNAYLKEAKKKACDKFKDLAGVYAGDYAQISAQ